MNKRCKIATICKQKSAANSRDDTFLCKLQLSLGASAVSVLGAGGLHWSVPWSDPTSEGALAQPRSLGEAQSDGREMRRGGDLQQPWCGIMPGLQGWHDIAGMDSRDEWTGRRKLAFSPVWKMSRNGIFYFTNQGCTSNTAGATVEYRNEKPLASLAEDAFTLLSDRY